MWVDCECPCGCGRLGWKLTGPRGGQQGEVKDALSPHVWKSLGDVPLTPDSLAWIQKMAFLFPHLPPLCDCWVKHGSPDLISDFTVVHILSLRSFNERAPASPCRTSTAPGDWARRRGVRRGGLAALPAVTSGKPSAIPGVGLDDPQRSLPTPNILWFCVNEKKTQTPSRLCYRQPGEFYFSL